jgi:LGFP repeat
MLLRSCRAAVLGSVVLAGTIGGLAGPAAAAEPTVSAQRAEGTCVLGIPGAYVQFDYRGAPPEGRRMVVTEDYPRVEKGSVPVPGGNGHAGVQIQDLSQTGHGFDISSDRQDYSASVHAYTSVDQCDNWSGPDNYNSTSNRALGYVSSYSPRPVRGGTAWNADNGALFQTYRGTHAVQGAIAGTYSRLRETYGPLGVPVTSEYGLPTRYGFYNLFENGAIYWSPQTGANAVVGEIYRRYAAIGYESSPLGLPTTSELPTPRRAGAYNHFERGSVYWSPATGAHEVYGAIRDAWAREGWESSWLGFPQSGEYQSGAYRRSDFQGGYIVWSPSTGAQVHRW